MPERPDPPDASSEDDAEDVGSSERERDEGASAPLGLRGADTGDAESLIRDESRIDAGGEDPLGPRSGLDDFLVEPAVGGAGRGSPAGSDAPATPSRTASGSGRPDLDALIADLRGQSGPQRGDTPAEGAPKDLIGDENLAAAVPSEGDVELMSSDLLDSLLAEAQRQDSLWGEPPPEPHATPAKPDGRTRRGIETPSPEELARELGDTGEEPVARRARVRVVHDYRGRKTDAEQRESGAKPPRRSILPRVRLRIPRLRFGPGLAKFLVLLAIGAIATSLAYYALSGLAQLPMARPTESPDLRIAIENAEQYLEFGRYRDAVRVLDAALSAASPQTSGVDDAEYLRLEAAYLALPRSLSEPEMQAFQARVSRVMDRFPTHSRNADAMRWKADLYQRGGMPHAADAAYEQALAEYSDQPDRDQVLLEAARLAMGLSRPAQAEERARQLLASYPTSRWTGEAQALLGDALRAQGRDDEAQQTFADLLRTRPDSLAGARAAARLADIALERGRMEEAVSLLERRLDAATVIDGNDEVYLLLARAYRQMGRTEDAEQVLRELISFFPDTPIVPRAYLELGTVLEAQGRATEAAQLILQASQRFPDAPDVLIALADHRARAGDHAGAGDALVAADDAGAHAPARLLEAGDQYRRAGEMEKCVEALDRLSLSYPGSPQAFDAQVLIARAHFDMGQARLALDQLEDLALLTEGRPQQLGVALALGDCYSELGLSDAAAEAFARVAAIATDPQILARAATALFDAGRYETGLNVAERVTPSALAPEAAYQFLAKHGRALLQVDAARGIELMEQAYERYPEFRTDENDLALLRGYLGSDRQERARTLVRDFEARARVEPQRTPLLIRGAVMRGDHLFERRDYSGAAAAYALASQTGRRNDPDVQWAELQYGSALLHAGDTEAALRVFDAVATGDSPWAAVARAKTDYARIEQRLRNGSPVVVAGGQP